MNEFETNQQQHREEFTSIDLSSLDSLSKLTTSIARNHGFETRFRQEIAVLGFEHALDNLICMCTALSHTEVSETLEEGRKTERSFDLLLEEQADVLMRTLNLMRQLIEIGKDYGYYVTTIENVVKAKVKRNIERPFKHGTKRF